MSELRDMLPTLPRRLGDGYDWMDAVNDTRCPWVVIPLWGRDGWNMGDWPLVIVVACTVSRDGQTIHGVATYCEGDIAITAHGDRDSFLRELDITAQFYWRISHYDGVPPIGPLAEQWHGMPRYLTEG